MADEVVCDSVESFKDACWKHGAFIPAYEIKPGEESTGFKNAPVLVRIVYRPPAPKPPPPIGCLRDEHIDALKRDGRFVLNGETILYEATPRDAAREAFEAWFGQFVYPGDLRSDLRAAFLAGRASVKP